MSGNEGCRAKGLSDEAMLWTCGQQKGTANGENSGKGWGEGRDQGDSGQRTQKTPEPFTVMTGPWQRGVLSVPSFLSSLELVDFQPVVGGQR